MRNVLICFFVIIVAFIAIGSARAENVIYGNSSTGPQQFNVNTSGQASISLLSGEDQTNSVFKVEHQYSYKIITADTQVKASAGFVHAISCATSAGAAATAGALTLRDALTETTPIANTIGIPATAFTPFGFVIDQVFTTGIYAGFDGTLAGVSCTVSYR